MIKKTLNPVEEDMRTALFANNADDWPGLVAWLANSDNPDRQEALKRIMTDVRPRLRLHTKR